MDNLLSGLAKFGLDETIANNIFGDDNVKPGKNNDSSVTKEVVLPKEEDFLILKTVRCPVCDRTFRTIITKSGRMKRKEPDLDLCPRFEGIDSNKYDVCSCPKCGYTALHRFFGPMPSIRVKLVREGFCQKFRTPPTKEITEMKTYSYDESIELMKLALYATIIKRGPNSEKAYECLKIAWLLRRKMEELSKDKEKNKDVIEACKKEYDSFYAQAFEGFVKAMASENYPMCGMDQNTLDMLIAAMAFNLGKYEYASRFVSGIIVSRTASSNAKKRATDLKEKIIEIIKKQ